MQGTTKKEQVKQEDLSGSKEPVIYIGETSRSIQERSIEHWKGYIGSKKEDNQLMAKFTMKVVGGLKTALNRQVSEAMRIRRRSGEHIILNSKTEYNRCHIPRLRVEQEEEIVAKEEQQRAQYDKIEEELNGEQLEWEQERRRMVKGSRKNTFKGSSRDIKTRRMDDDLGSQECSRTKKNDRNGGVCQSGISKSLAEYVQRHLCFFNVQLSLHENVVFSVYTRIGNAAYIVFIMWNSISGLDAWYHFWFNISCGLAVMVRSQIQLS